MTRTESLTGLILTTIAGLIGGPSLAQAPAPQARTNIAPAPQLGREAPIPSVELEAFVDGVVGTAMARDHLVGVTLAIVQDGQTILKKGYGFSNATQRVDPDQTLFRIGSISKTFTWIAVMKEVEAGRMRLDGPINDYLPGELAVPAIPGWRPVELRDLMSHTPGFEDRILDMFAETPAQLRPLAAKLRLDPPKRVFPPGTVIAYSNFGVMLAGEAVAHLEGIGFPDVIEREITTPLGMTRTSFREPYPARGDLPAPMTTTLAADLSTGYRFAEGVLKAQPTEWLSQVAPAGGASTTATDMTRYLIMMLSDGEWNGVRIYSRATAAAFRSPNPIPAPNGGQVDHGFVQTPLPGGFMGYGHDGETLWFHSMLETVPALRLGIFVSTNTDTGNELVHELPQQIIEHFYAAPPDPPLSGLPALAKSADYAGTYIPNRRPHSGLQKFLFLLINQASVEVSDEGYLITQSSGETGTWIPSEPPGHFRAVGSALTTDFGMRASRGMEWDQSGGTESFARVGPLYRRSTLLFITLLANMAAVGSLIAAATQVRRQRKGSGMQRRLNRALLLASGAWLIALGAFAAFANGAANLRNLIFDWPGVPLLSASCAALLASILSAAMLVTLPFAWIGKEGWGLGRKLRFSATTVLFSALGLLLAMWGFLTPWNS
jgi:CubicO group peptidase (beta-lactamase class C family)